MKNFKGINEAKDELNKAKDEVDTATKDDAPKGEGRREKINR